MLTQLMPTSGVPQDSVFRFLHLFLMYINVIRNTSANTRINSLQMIQI